MGGESEEVVIAGNDKIGLRGDGEGQHNVVVRIAADRFRQGWRVDEFGQVADLSQDLVGGRQRSVRGSAGTSCG
jgi:hypothetical protein